jgi:hypothetical protein
LTIILSYLITNSNDTSIIMSRRRGEFEHRTSLFEGAYRAWSHLGGLDPDDLVSKPPEELDPLNMTHFTSSPKTTAVEGAASSDTNVTEITASKTVVDEVASEINSSNPDKREWSYEPLPRSGLEHPYVRSIINPWLGSDNEDPDEVEQGLATLRNWWQHRRKGESRSAISALGSVKMREIVDGYTRHFFKLALELVKRDNAHSPKTLLAKMGGPKSERNRRNKPKRKKDHSEDEEEVSEIMTSLAGARSLEGISGGTSLALGLPVLGGLEVLTGTGNDIGRSTSSALTEHNLSFLSGLGSSSGPQLDQASSAIDLLLQQQRQITLDPLELAQLARQRQLMAATSVLTPLEQIHLLQRERQLALLSTAYSTPLTTSSITLPQSSTGLSNYCPPSWLLEPFPRKAAQTPPTENKST